MAEAKGVGLTRLIKSSPTGQKIMNWFDNIVDEAFPSSNMVTTEKSSIPPLKETTEATPTTYVLDGVQITKKQYNNLDVSRRKTVEVIKGQKAQKAEVEVNPLFKIQGIPTSKGEESYLTRQLEEYGIDPFSPRAIDVSRTQADTLGQLYTDIDIDVMDNLDNLIDNKNYNFSTKFINSIKSLASVTEARPLSRIEEAMDQIPEGILTGDKYYQESISKLKESRKKLLKIINRELQNPTNNLQQRDSLIEQVDYITNTLEDLQFKETAINQKYGFGEGRSAIENPALSEFGGDVSQLIGTPFEVLPTQKNVQANILSGTRVKGVKSEAILNFYSPSISTIIKGDFEFMKAGDVVPYILKQEGANLGPTSRATLQKIDEYLKQAARGERKYISGSNIYSKKGATLGKTREAVNTNLTKDDIIAVINAFEPKFTSYVEDNTGKILKLKENYINKNISGQELIDGMVELGRLTDKGVAVRYGSAQRQRIANFSQYRDASESLNDLINDSETVEGSKVFFGIPEFTSTVKVKDVLKTLMPPNIGKEIQIVDSLKGFADSVMDAQQMNYFNITLNAQELNFQALPFDFKSRTGLSSIADKKRTEQLYGDIDTLKKVNQDFSNSSREDIIQLLKNSRLIKPYYKKTNLELEKAQGLNLFESKNLFSNDAVTEVINTTSVPEANVEKGIALQRLKKKLGGSTDSVNEEEFVSLDDLAGDDLFDDDTLQAMGDAGIEVDGPRVDDLELTGGRNLYDLTEELDPQLQNIDVTNPANEGLLEAVFQNVAAGNYELNVDFRVDLQNGALPRNIQEMADEYGVVEMPDILSSDFGPDPVRFKIKSDINTIQVNDLALGEYTSTTNYSNQLLGLLDKIYSEKYGTSVINTIYDKTGQGSKNINRKQIAILENPTLLKELELELESKVTGDDIVSYFNDLESKRIQEANVLQEKNYRRSIDVPTHTDRGDVAHLRGSIFDTVKDERVLLVEELQSDLFASMQEANIKSYVSPERFQKMRREEFGQLARRQGQKFMGMPLQREELIGNSYSQYVEKLIQSAIVYGKKQGVNKIVMPDWKDIAKYRTNRANPIFFKNIYEDTVRQVFKKFEQELDGAVKYQDDFLLAEFDPKIRRDYTKQDFNRMNESYLNIKKGKGTAEDYSHIFPTKQVMALDISNLKLDVGGVPAFNEQRPDLFLDIQGRAVTEKNLEKLETAKVLDTTRKQEDIKREQFPIVGRYNKGGLMVKPKSRVN